MHATKREALVSPVGPPLDGGPEASAPARPGHKGRPYSHEATHDPPQLAAINTRANIPGAIASRALVVGCGNSLFGDDALGQLIAERIADAAPPGVLALAVHELTPELAAHVAATETVYFVDAALHGTEVEFAPLAVPDAAATHLDHALTPRALLALSAHAFGRAPAAWVVLVPGEDFTLGHSISSRAQSGIACALAWFERRW